MRRFQRVFAIVFAIALTVSALAVGTPTTVYAANTISLTMVKGETIYYTPDGYNIKSVSSSKKSVLTAKKNSDESTQVVLTAKEKGTSKVTIKTDRGTRKYSIKVVGNAIKIKAVQQIGNYLVYKITNNTSVTFDKFYFNWTAKDSDGDVLKEGNAENNGYGLVYYLTAKSVAYEAVYIGAGNTASLKKSTAKADLTSHNRYLGYKYTDQSSKIKVTVTDTVGDRNVEFKVKFKSSVNENVSAVADLILYDSDDQIVDIINITKYLSKKETSSKEAISYYTADLYDHYKVVERAYSSTSIR